jgi:hypothetical protein
MDTQDESILNLWRCLNLNNVQYLMIGGFAVNMHGFHRFTHDIDILIDDSVENRKKFRQALIDAQIGDFSNIETMDIIPGYTNILLDGGMELDIFNELPGFETVPFHKIRSESAISTIFDLQIPFLHINQLLHSKRITNRPKDIIDIEELEKIQNTKDESN